MTERIQSINPQRILWCCNDRSITVAELAAKVGLSESVITNLVQGESGITFNQLEKIARYFDRGTLFFLEQDPVIGTQVHTPQFRTITNQKPEASAEVKGLIERVERQRDLYISLREGLDESRGPIFQMPDISGKPLNEIAVMVRAWLNLTERNDYKTYRKAVEDRGILVFQSNGYKGRWQIPKNSPVCSFSLYQETCPVIVVKKQRFESRQVFSLIHELGHILLHKDSFLDEQTDFYSYRGKERDVNAFAGLLLVPDSFLALIDDRTRPAKVNEYDDWLEYYRKNWGVSGEVILRRLYDVGRLKKDKYEEYRRWRDKIPVDISEGGTRQYRYREPRNIFGDPFVRTVFDALNTQKITLAKASTYLDNLKIKDVHQLEGYYARL
ncbi:MAG: XRE family transcriptional regulator [Candidatus Moraniibacteriota bacterium]